jgi:hypothetical protein
MPLRREVKSPPRYGKGQSEEHTDELGIARAKERAGEIGRELVGEPIGARADGLRIEFAGEPADEWYRESGEERAGEPGDELAGELSSELATQLSVELAAEPANKLGEEPAIEPGTELAVESGRVWPQRRGRSRLEQTNGLLHCHLCHISVSPAILQRCRIRPARTALT